LISLVAVLTTATAFCATAQGRSLAGGGAAARAYRVRPLMPDGGRGPLPFTRWRRLRRHLDRQVSAAIVNGTTAIQGQLGFMAFVFAELGSNEQLCSGTVISSNVVLTAAHCAYDESTGQLLDPSDFTIVTGAVDWTDATTRQLSPVSQVIVDPAYDPATHDSDVALLVLSRPTTAPVIALANGADSGLTIPGTSAGIAGWGLTYQGSPLPTVLQWATTVVQPPAYCGQFVTTYDSSAQLCAVDYPYDDDATCNGDSGGPLLAASAAQLYEIGVVSYGPANCNTVSADYFTSMMAVQPWIASEVQAAAPPPPPPPPIPPTPIPPAPTPTTSTTAPSTPAPPASTRPSLPQLSPTTARTDARAVLAGALGNVFDHGHAYKPSCSRASSTRFACAFTFSNGANDYYGDITVYYVNGSGGKIYWTDRYTLHWVNDSCYFHSGHRRRCTIHKRQGTW
jgi:hypothetical protein